MGSRGRFEGTPPDQLVTSSDPEDRFWVARNIRSVSPHKSVDILRRLIRDPDEDVSQEAQRQLILIGNDSDRRSIRDRWLRQLHSPAPSTSEAALWALVRTADRFAIDGIATFMRDDGNPWKSRAGEVAIQAIEGRYGDLSKRLMSHDHAYTKWLAVALALRGHRHDVEIVERASISLPDDRCRGYCRGALKIAPTWASL
jgi:hypothetical protein